MTKKEALALTMKNLYPDRNGRNPHPTAMTNDTAMIDAINTRDDTESFIYTYNNGEDTQIEDTERTSQILYKIFYVIRRTLRENNILQN
jgi:hypothetical protein